MAVADLGSFRRAAERLNTTQPNISARIANLETRLGLSLMVRDAGSVRLTPKGRHLLSEARAVLAAMEAFLVAAGDDALFEGVMRLGVTELIAHTWLRAYLVALKARFPNVVVELTVDLSEPLSAALYARELDLALQNGPYDRILPGSIPLGCSPWIWVAAPGLGLSGSVTGADLAQHPVLTHARQTRPHQQLADHFRGVSGVRLAPASNIAVVLQMTLDGLGLSCLPAPMVEAHIESHKLVALDYSWRPHPLEFEARFESDTSPVYVGEAARLAAEIAGQTRR